MLKFWGKNNSKEGIDLSRLIIYLIQFLGTFCFSKVIAI